MNKNLKQIIAIIFLLVVFQAGYKLGLFLMQTNFAPDLGELAAHLILVIFAILVARWAFGWAAKEERSNKEV